MADALLIAVLAAGRGSRFGGGKLDADLAGKPVGRWVLDAVATAGLPPGIIVVPPACPRFAATAPGWSVLENPAASQGLGTSVARAAQAATALGVGRLLVLLGDMPLLDPDHLHRLLAAAGPAATRYPGGQPGVPAAFPAALLPALARVKGDRGAAAVLRGRGDVHLIDPPAGMLADIDRPADLAQAVAALGGQSGA